MQRVRRRASAAVRLCPRKPSAGNRRRAVEAIGSARQRRCRRRTRGAAKLLAAQQRIRCSSTGNCRAVPLYPRDSSLPGAQLTGPAIIVEPLTTTIIDPGWQAIVLSGGELLMEATRSDHAPARYSPLTQSAFEPPIPSSSSSSTTTSPPSPRRWASRSAIRRSA